MKGKFSLSRATLCWLVIFAAVWVVSCAWLMLFGLAPSYLILVFGGFQFVIFPVLLFGVSAAAGWKADLGFFRWLMPVLLGLLYSIWPLNMLLATKPAPPELSFVLFGTGVSYLGLAAGTIVRRVRAFVRNRSTT